MDDMHPSGKDKRPAVQAGSTGSAVGQNAPDFSLPDTLGGSVTLSTELTATAVKGVVVYFTMWCPICDGHMSSIRSTEIPIFPSVKFYAVDYVSGSVSEARNEEISNGYDGSGFRVLADTGQYVLNRFNATMGTTVVIDKTGQILMNEDYKDGSRLHAILSTLP